MALQEFGIIIPDFIGGLRQMAARVAFITDTYAGGDLPLADVDAVFSAYARVAAAEAEIRTKIAGGADEQSFVLDQLVGSGITGLTLGQIGTALDNLATAVAAWRTALLTILPAIPDYTLPIIQVPNRYGGTIASAVFRAPVNFEETQGLQIKNAQPTANLRAALAALNAI